MAEKNNKKNKNEFKCRIYDIDILNTVKKVLSSGRYSSANALLNDCITIALPYIVGKDKIPHKSKSIEQPVDDKKIMFTLDELFVKVAIIEKLLSVLYNIAYHEAEGSAIDIATFESRVLEQLPKPLAELQAELEKAYSRYDEEEIK